MKTFFLILFLYAIPNYSVGREEFIKLRDRHLGDTVAQQFSAYLDKSSAKKLIQNKVDEPYNIEVLFNSNKGMELWVRGQDTFYERLLSSYETYINTMMFPLLNTSAYTRLQKRFNIEYTNNIFTLSYLKGDIPTKYIFKTGEFDLVDEIQYFENDKKIYTFLVKWTKIEQKYVPNSIKSISYVKTRQAISFKMENITLK